MKTTPTSIVGCFGEKALEKIENTRELEIRRGLVKPLVMMTVVVLCLTSQLEDFSSHNLFLSKEFVVQILEFVTKHSPKYNHKLFSYVESTVLISTFLKKLHSCVSQPL